MTDVAGHIKLKNVFGSRFSLSHKILSVEEYEKQLSISKNGSLKPTLKFLCLYANNF